MASGLTVKLRKAALAGITSVLGFAASSASAEVIRVQDMLQGMHISAQQCSMIGEAVWVNIHNQGFCIRYYLSTEGGSTGKPIVFLQGDQFGRLDPRTRNFSPSPELRDTDTAKLRNLAHSMSRAGRTPAIYLARIGVDGSSGHHRVRRTVLELHVVNAALEQIRAKYGFDGFHLVGQSGGSGLIGGLLALRSDIACAVPGAGRLSHLRQQRETGDPSRDYFNPDDAVGMIAANRGARIIVITDPQDQVVGVQYQVAFVNAMRRHGRAIEQYFVQATDEKNHGVLAYAGRAVVLCAQNAPASRIATDLDLLVKKRVAEAQQRRQSQMFPQPLPQPYPQTTRVAPSAAGYGNAPAATGYAPPASYQPVVPGPSQTQWPSLPPRAQNGGVYR